MKFEIYCDESGQEAMADKTAHRFFAIGGIWVAAGYRNELKEKIAKIKSKHSIGGEIKWRKISPAYVAFYKEVIDCFFTASRVRFRVIVVESEKLDNNLFNGSDAELGFYKFYYQLIKHWIFDNNEYRIFTDFKLNGSGERIRNLHKFLQWSNCNANIIQVQALHSNESIGVQLADLLTGAVAAKFNNQTQSIAKKEIIAHIESYLGRPIEPTRKTENKFCVFNINLRQGW